MSTLYATLMQAVDVAAASVPSTPAVIDDRNAVSYSELRALSFDVAKSLIGLGVEPGDRVACLMRNRIEWVASAIGAARVGATFVPLNTWYKQQELGWTLRHTDAVVLLAERSFLGHDFAADLDLIEPATRTGALPGPMLPKLRHVVFVDPGDQLGWDRLVELGTGVSDVTLEERQQAVPEDAGLFLLYTSGSTAEPKGVLLPQSHTVTNGIGIGDRRGIEAGDRIWLGSPLFYGLGATNALPVSLTHHATLVLQDRFDPVRAIETIERHTCNVFYGMSNMIRQIRDCSAYDPRRLSTLTKGTAGIERAEREVLLTEFGVTGATQSYGATEVCGNCLGGHPDDRLDLKLDTCGRLLPGFEAKIVDPVDGDPLAPGEVGLLKVRGYTALGYFKNPGETEAAFDHEGYYATGDLGSFDTDGYFRYSGRIKEMIKTGGINVSPAEIEALVLSHPGIKEAYVVGVEDRARGEIPVAFVVAGDSVTEKDVQEHVKGLAAAFKVPRRVLFIESDAVPRTASGKVAKPELRAQVTERD